MSSLRKMLSIIDLFKANQSIITIDDVIKSLDISAPTAYRYIKELCNSGLIVKVSSSEYTIGPKIIKLDYQIRTSDPIIVAGKIVMQELVFATGCEVLLSNIYNDEVLNIYSEVPMNYNNALTYRRGNPHPIFKGATSKIILANLPKRKLQKLYSENSTTIAEENLGETWEEFYDQLYQYKRAGYCITHGELDNGMTGIAAPVFYNGNSISGSITIVLPTNRLHVYNTEKLVELLLIAADKINQLTIESNNE